MRDIFLNNELEEKFTNFMKSSIDLLRKKYGGYELPYSKTLVPEKKEGLSLAYSEGKELDFTWYLYQCGKALGSLKETQIFIDELLQNQITGKWFGQPKNQDGTPYTKKETYTWYIGNRLSNVFNRYLKETKSYKFKKNVCKKVFQELMEFLQTDFETFTNFAPLTGFYSEVAEIELEKNLIIRGITNQELQRIFSHGQSMHLPSSTEDTYYIDFVVTTTYTRKINKAYNDSQSKVLFDKVTTALRLFKKGTLGFNYYYSTPNH